MGILQLLVSMQVPVWGGSEDQCEQCQIDSVDTVFNAKNKLKVQLRLISGRGSELQFWYHFLPGQDGRKGENNSSKGSRSASYVRLRHLVV